MTEPVWTTPLSVEAQTGDWYLILQNLCVALGHPLNRGGTRGTMAAFVRQLGHTLRHEGVVSRQELTRLWAKAGITDARPVDYDEHDRCPTCQQPLVLGQP